MSERIEDKSDRAVGAVYIARWAWVAERCALEVPSTTRHRTKDGRWLYRALPDAEVNRRYAFVVAWEVEKDWSFPAEQIERVLKRLNFGWDRETGEPVGVWR